MVFMVVMDKSGMIIFGIISALLHEIGHLIAAYFQNNKIKKINFGFASVDIISSEQNFESGFLVLTSGSLVNFILALIFEILYLYFGSLVYNGIAYQNLCIGIFNLLPINSLDGGQIFFSLLNKKIDFLLAEKISNIVSFIFLVPVCILGFLVLINSKYNFSLLILSCYLISYICFKENL